MLHHSRPKPPPKSIGKPTTVAASTWDWHEVLKQAGYPTDYIILDFETYFDESYSLRKDNWSTIEYIQSDLFEETGLGVYRSDLDQYIFYQGEDLVATAMKCWRETLGSDMPRFTVAAHNAVFDLSIMAFKHGLYPKYAIDLLGVARHWSSRSRNAVEHLAERFELETRKGDTGRFKGWTQRRRMAPRKKGEPPSQRPVFTDEKWAELKEYTLDDVRMEHELFKQMLPLVSIPKTEFRVMTHTLELFTKPSLMVDYERAEELVHQMENELSSVIGNLNKFRRDNGYAGTVERADISGNNSFEALLLEALQDAGDDPDQYKKPAKNKQGWKFAVAKDDAERELLMEHTDEHVRRIMDAFAAIKSWPNHIKRVNRIVDQSKAADGYLPVPLRYHGAHTGRWSGGECVTGDHEVLTKRGWVPIAEWDSKEAIAQWHDGRITFVSALKNTHGYSGPLYHMEGASLSLRCTPNHRIVGETPKGQPVDDHACEVRNCFVPASGIDPTEPVFSDDQTRLIIACQADGWFRYTGAGTPYAQFRFTKQRKIDRLTALLTRLDIPFTTQDYGDRGVNFNLGVATPHWLSPNIKETLPVGLVPSVVVNELFYWDGTRFGEGSGVATCQNRQIIDDLQSYAIRAGWSASVVEYTAQSGSPHYRINLSHRHRLFADKRKWTTTRFHGKVYCPTVPSGKWVVRHNGKVHVTGNSINLQNLGSRGHALVNAIRELLIAPPGHELVIADASQIEARVLAWIAGQQDLVEKFANGEEIYCGFASKVLGRKIRKPVPEHLWAEQGCIPAIEKRMKWARNSVGKVGILGCGYGMGAAKAEGYAGGAIDFETAQQIVDVYRADNAKITQFWRDLEKAFMYVVKTGQAIEMPRGLKLYTHPKADVVIQLPNGRELKYHNVRLKEGQYGPAAQIYEPTKKKWQHTWGGSLCLAGDTRVLVERGWVQLVDVRITDRVWDGIEWVSHEGCIYQGIKNTITANGIRMTHDHRIFTTEGVVPARAATGLNWADVRLPDGTHSVTLGRSQVVLERPLQMRKRIRGVRERYYPERQGYSRMPVLFDEGERGNARHDQASGILGVAEYAGPVSPPNSPSVAQLRRPRDRGLQTMEEVRELLGRYGSDIPAGIVARSNKQRRKLRTEQLSVDDCESAGQQSPVYDLLNCGPRRRFVVQDGGGVPRLVHNCENVVQAISRDLLWEAVQAMEDTGYHVPLHVHDELISVVKEGVGKTALEAAIEFLSTRPDWAPDCPLAAEGHVTTRYGGH